MQTPVSVILKHKGDNIYSASPDETVFDCITQMNEVRVGALLVLKEGKPTDIFTEHDVTTKLLPKGLDPKSTAVSDVMSKELFVIPSNTTIEEAMALKIENATPIMFEID